MSKKIIISEEAINRLGLRLNPELYRMLKDGHTSIGRSEALPGDSLEFQYGMLKNRLSDVTEAMQEVFPDLVDDREGAVNEIRHLINVAMEHEKGIRPQLEKICENTINRLFPIPEETVLFECKLSDSVQSKYPFRVMPEGGEGYSYEDVDDSILMDREVAKRRVIDCLIMGASYWFTLNAADYWEKEISEIDQELPELYAKIGVLDDYLLFIDNQKITDDSPKMNAYVSVRLGGGSKKTEIKACGILFPYLLKEAVRGFMELFSSHGLPENNERAMEIIKRADFIVAEPWDIRLGIPMWEKVWNTKKFGTRAIPYYFAYVSKMDVDGFNDFMKNMMLSTRKGKEMRLDIVKNLVHSSEYQKFKNRMQQKNVDRSVIEDGDFTAEELNDVKLEENNRQ